MKAVKFLRLPKEDRRVVAERFMEIGNIAAGSLLFNQFFLKELSISGAVLGIICIVLTYFLGIQYLKGD